MLLLSVSTIQAVTWLIRVVIQIGHEVTLSGVDSSNDFADSQFRRPPLHNVVWKLHKGHLR
jgi:hypothetical protein